MLAYVLILVYNICDNVPFNSQGLLNGAMFVMFTPSVLGFGYDGFRWALIFIMLPWMGIKVSNYYNAPNNIKHQVL